MNPDYQRTVYEAPAPSEDAIAWEAAAGIVLLEQMLQRHADFEDYCARRDAH